MSELLAKIRELVEIGKVRISEHGYDELSEDRIPVRDSVRGLREPILVEEYPASGRGPAVLVLEYDLDDRPIRLFTLLGNSGGT